MGSTGKLLYVMRHGETRFNIKGRTQGMCDSPLTERGIEQSRAAHAFLERPGVEPDLYVTSPLGRAVETLQVLIGDDAPFERVWDLREQDMGDFEGEDRNLQPPFPFGDYYATRGGESDAVVVERVVAAARELMGRPGIDQVFAVTHGLVYAHLLKTSGIVKMAAGAHIDADPPNGCIVTLEYQDDGSFLLTDYFVPDAEQGPYTQGKLHEIPASGGSGGDAS